MVLETADLVANRGSGEGERISSRKSAGVFGEVGAALSSQHQSKAIEVEHELASLERLPINFRNESSVPQDSGCYQFVVVVGRDSFTAVRGLCDFVVHSLPVGRAGAFGILLESPPFEVLMVLGYTVTSSQSRLHAFTLSRSGNARLAKLMICPQEIHHLFQWPPLLNEENLDYVLLLIPQSIVVL